MLYKLSTFPITIFSLFLFLSPFSYSQENANYSKELEPFVTLISEANAIQKKKAIRTINRQWKSSYGIMVLETFYFSNNSELRLELLTLLQDKTRRNFGYDSRRWYKWFWNNKYTPHKDYHTFKAFLHKKIDSRFERYF